MMTNISKWVYKQYEAVALPFLLFLIGITSVKLQIKIIVAVLYLIYILIKKRSTKLVLSGPLIFYILMPLIGIIGAACMGAFQFNTYWFGAAFATIVWFLCGLTFFLLQTSVSTLDPAKLKKSISVFFLFNALVCLVELIKMMIASRHIFPYWYSQLDSIYGVSSGDHMHGIFQDNSTVNAAVMLISVFYFLFIKKYGFAFCTLLICLLCTSNLTIFILLFLIGITFICFRSQRKLMFMSGLACLGMYLFISPNNFNYIKRVFTKINHEQEVTAEATSQRPELTAEVLVTKNDSEATVLLTQDSALPIAPTQEGAKGDAKTSDLVHHIATQACIPYEGRFPMAAILQDFKGPIEANLGSNSLYLKDRIPEDTNALRRVMEKWYGVPYDSLALAKAPQAGKLLYLKHTWWFLKSSPCPFLFGAGPGNFSSKLAIKMTGFKLQGSYPERFRYISKSYFENSFFVHMYFWARSIPTRSIINYPGSVYCQLGGEYGVLGLFCFAFFYVAYFIRMALLGDKRKLIFILALLLLFFFDFWFEMLTITVFFELFMLLPLDNATQKTNPIDEKPLGVE